MNTNNTRVVCQECGDFHEVPTDTIKPSAREIAFRLPIGGWLVFLTVKCEGCNPFGIEEGETYDFTKIALSDKAEVNAALQIKDIVSEIHGLFENARPRINRDVPVDPTK